MSAGVSPASPPLVVVAWVVVVVAPVVVVAAVVLVTELVVVAPVVVGQSISSPQAAAASAQTAWRMMQRFTERASFVERGQATRPAGAGGAAAGHRRGAAQ